ncbi:hypothetical protein DFH06DRAFT_1345699 [Mycena polygramma]|nr:hypothetical protein DFH06DRAFT_1345699 [Mycena polygramma]
MSFFTHSSVVIQGGTFYSTAGNVNIQNDHKLVIEAPAINPEQLWQGGTPSAAGPQNVPELCPRVVSWSTGQGVGTPAKAGMVSVDEIATGIQALEVSQPSSSEQHPYLVQKQASLPSPTPAHDSNAYPPPNGVRDDYPLAHPEPTMTIRDGTFIGGNVINTVSHVETGINILHRASVPDAFHDPPDGHAMPRCHPETRVEMQQKLLKWCGDLQWSGPPMKTQPNLLWLHGPAGAGKSAIMATLSHYLENDGRLGGAFFFKRGHAARGNARGLFSTIALQLAVNSPQLKPGISGTVAENPTLVNRSLSIQLQELILKPCMGMHDTPWTIIIDGLDECEGQSVQQNILRLILHSTSQRTPFRFIIASRPEAHICEVLHKPLYHGLYRAFDVESCFEDVRRYLVAEFGRILREHSTMARISRPWPSKEVIDYLVHKSSGYFIYATTVIKFVDDKDFRPAQQLAALVDGTWTSFNSPFGALDELYNQILSTVPKHHQLVSILRVIDTIPRHYTLAEIDIVLHLEPGDTRLCLRRLHAVIAFTEEYGDECGDVHPYFFHASFSDFLGDPSRAGDFFIGDSPGVMVATSLLTDLGYKYDDPVRNSYPLTGFMFRLPQTLKYLLPQLEPSQELVHLLSAVNYDFISDDDFGILAWLKEAQILSEDLILSWEDHDFIKTFANTWSRDDRVAAWHRVSRRVMEHAVQCPLLLQLCCGMLWISTPIRTLVILRHLLNISWGEIHATVYPLQSILYSSDLGPDMREFAKLVINEWMISHPHWRANICSELAKGCIRVGNMIATGRLPSELLLFRIPWGLLIRGSPACPKLLCSVQQFVPPMLPSGQDRDQSWHTLYAEQCHNIIMWLEAFPERPVEEIGRWGSLFIESRRRASNLSETSLTCIDLHLEDPESYEARWQKWDEDYPECTESLGSTIFL